MTKTVTLTLAQAETALRCVEACSYFSDTLEATFELRRVELRQRLNTAINNAMKDN
jgi:hypothetical protein